MLAVMCSAPFNLAAQMATSSETAICFGCHGQGGVSINPIVPTLAGQPYTLIEDNLLAFRAGKRACAPERGDGSPEALLAQTMCTTVADLGDQQISALSEYFSSQEFVPAKQTFDQSLVGQGAEVHQEKNCEQCHSDGGRTTNFMAPVLAGQWMPYLRRTMHALREGLRQSPRVMNDAMSQLKDGELEALLNFYASQGQAE